MRPIRLNQKGFSLMELIIVIAILGVLTALVVPSLSGRVSKTKDTVCLANRATLERELSNAALMENPGADILTRKSIIERVLAERGDIKCPAGGTYRCSAAANTAVHVFCDVHAEEWTKGRKFEADDIMVTNLKYIDGSQKQVIFRCLKSHTTGSRSNTRNPAVKSNKGSWELIGTVDGSVPAYNATPRFAEGSLCTYNGNYYSRTDYNLTGGQTPYSKSSSRYWILVGPVAP